MKKIFVSLILCLALVLGLSLSAGAAGIGYVSDTAGILSREDAAALNEQAETVSEFYGCGVYIVVVDDYKNYVNGSVADFSEAVYNSYALGLGQERNGIILSLSMAERDYDLRAYGDFAHYAFTDYGKDKLSGTFLDNFRNDDWTGGFNDYIANAISLMDMAKQGNPLDTLVYDEVREAPGWDAFELALIVAVPSLIALAVCAVFAAQMKTSGRQSYAMNYVADGRANLRIRSDRFLNRSVVRTRIRRDDDGPRAGGGGGRPGGTTINSGGFSGKSGKF